VFVQVPFLICGCLLLAAIGINITNVVGRYVFNAPVPWAEEVMSYAIIWGVFVAGASITYQGLHLRMDLIAMSVRGWAAHCVGGLTVVLILTCSIFVVVQSYRILLFYIGSGETSMGARIPLLYPHAAIFVGFALMAAAAAVRFRSYLANRFD
jgi:TRAP-type C4-dicarboxylate transport system permease small subunit